MRLHRNFGHGLKDLVDPESGILHRASRYRAASERKRLRDEYNGESDPAEGDVAPTNFADGETEGIPSTNPHVNKDGTFTYGGVTFDPR